MRSGQTFSEDKTDFASQTNHEYQLSTLTQNFYWGIGYVHELMRDPLSFVIDYLYPIASRQGYAIAPAFSPVLAYFGKCPQIVVLGPHDQDALRRLFQYGEKRDDDAEAREPLNPVEAATGTPREIILPLKRKEDALVARKELKKHLNNICDVYKVTYEFAENIANNWDNQFSYQHNMRYIISNIIGQCVFGIPHIPIDAMDTLEEISKALFTLMPKDPAFIAASQKLQALSDRLVSEDGQEMIDAKKFVASQLAEGEGIERLCQLKAGCSILVEGNLSNLIMIALEQIMRNPIIKNTLRHELEYSDIQFDFLSDNEIDEVVKKLNDLTYLKKIYLEALRFINPAIISARKTGRATEWTVRDEYGQPHHFKVNAGSYLFAPLRAMSHSEDLWQNPQEFNPERFNGDESTFASQNLSPFITGNRACPAAGSFVRQVFNLLIVMTVKNYEFTLTAEMLPIPANAKHVSMEPPAWIKTHTFRNTMN